MPSSLDHIGIAVSDLEAAMEDYVQKLGFKLEARESVPTEHVNVAMLRAGTSRVELLEPTDDSSAISRFLQSGKKGIHHLAFEVEDIEKELAMFREKGVTIIEPAPREGAGGCKVAFIHPKSTQGVLLELVERPT